MKIDRMLDLTGKVAIVTGGTGWLGASISEALLELCAQVYAPNRGVSHDFAVDIAERFNIQFHNIKCDVTDKGDLEAFIKNIIHEQGSIDILVNNSTTWSTKSNFLDATWDGLKESLESNVVSQLYLTKLVFEQMMKQGSGGSIINIASMYSRVSPDFSMYRGVGGNAIEYGAAKAAIVQSTKYVASLGGQHNIRVNSVSPGPFSRPGAFTGKEWFREELEKRTMLHRIGHPQELMGVIAFLASDLSTYVTGVDIPVDGGWTSL